MADFNEPAVKKVFQAYPNAVREQMLYLRALIFQVADEENVKDLIETLKWGEPSYLCKTGSTLRIDWKPKYPDHYSVYLNCKSKLLDTYKEIYPTTFEYHGNREIRIPIGAVLPEPEIMHCIALSLKYHKVKNLPLLGA